jgi:hypothetical protein
VPLRRFCRSGRRPQARPPHSRRGRTVRPTHCSHACYDEPTFYEHITPRNTLHQRCACLEQSPKLIKSCVVRLFGPDMANATVPRMFDLMPVGSSWVGLASSAMRLPQASGAAGEPR